MVCSDWIQPGPTEIQDENTLIKWVPQNETQVQKSLAATRSSSSSSTLMDLDHIAFFRFCRHGQMEEADAMLAAGIVQVDFLDPQNSRQSALFGASDQGHAAVVRMLLARGAQVTLIDAQNNTVISLLLSRELLEPGHMEGISTHFYSTFSRHNLLSHAHYFCNPPFDKNPLIHFSFINNFSNPPSHFTIVLRVLTTAGADLRHVDNNGRTLLHIACLRNHLEASRYFLEHGADVRAVDNQGKGILHLIASSERGVQFLEFLPWMVGAESSGAEGNNSIDVNLVDSSGKTALFIACEHRRTEFVKALVEMGHPDCNLSPTGSCSLDHVLPLATAP